MTRNSFLFVLSAAAAAIPLASCYGYNGKQWWEGAGAAETAQQSPDGTGYFQTMTDKARHGDLRPVLEEQLGQRAADGSGKLSTSPGSSGKRAFMPDRLRQKAATKREENAQIIRSAATSSGQWWESEGRKRQGTYSISGNGFESYTDMHKRMNTCTERQSGGTKEVEESKAIDDADPSNIVKENS